MPRSWVLLPVLLALGACAASTAPAIAAAPDQHRVLAAQLCRDGAPGEAVGSFLSASASGPERGDAYWGLGVAGHAIGYPDRVIGRCVQRAQASLPELPQGLFSDLGRVWQERGQHARAIGRIEQALSRDPDVVEAHGGLARAHLAMGKQATAEPPIAAVRRPRSSQ